MFNGYKPLNVKEPGNGILRFRLVFARMATISTAFENAISESLHFQSLVATANGGSSLCRGKR